jgi:nitrite reductase (NADH) large subunit
MDIAAKTNVCDYNALKARSSVKFAIVGCGVAGTSAALAIRKNSSDAEISVYTDENDFYYPRPRLYEVISGEREPQDLYSYQPQFYENQRIKVYLKKKVVNIDLVKKEIQLEDGSRAGWDRLLLANGANPFVPPMNGLGKSGVFTLRTIEDAVSIRERLKKTSNAIVIGTGLLGLELAASLRKAGRKVEVIGLDSRLLPRQLDNDGSEILKKDLEEMGIVPVLSARCKEILGKDEVDGVSLEDGRELQGGIMVVAAGVRPNIGLALDAGIKVAQGVVVDQHLQTSANDVYAAGDVIEFKGQVYGQIPPALEQAKIAALNMLGKNEQVYAGTVQRTTLRIAGISLMSMGLVNPEGSGFEEIKKANREEGEYGKVVLEKGRIVGAVLLGKRVDVATITRLMDKGIDVSDYKHRLLDADLKNVIPTA